MYDIIGDVHGQSGLLKKLLQHLGYTKTLQGYKHPERKAIFLGDFINRGPRIKKTIRIIRNMVENGNALSVIGNHEINFIISVIKDKNWLPLGKMTHRNFISGFKTLKEFSNDPDELASHLKWMRTLPFYIDLPDIRIIHACWAKPAIDYLNDNLPAGRIRKKVFRKLYADPYSELSQNIWLITKGPQFKMPGDLRVKNNKGVAPRSFRIRWWEEPYGKTFQDISFESKYRFPSYTVPGQILPVTYPYDSGEPILFFGHYCRFSGPHIIRPNLCCLDSCVNTSKTLTAYQWNGEKKLLENNLIQISNK
jgi:hypothetical protein